MSYLKPSLTPLHADQDSASCCTPLVTVNLGRVVVGGGCIAPSPRQLDALCLSPSSAGTVCIAGSA